MERFYGKIRCMKVRFLGTGTSTGVPQIGCRCEVCLSSDRRDKRLRSSVRLEVDNKLIMIDCTPDFRQQVMHLPYRKIDGYLFTHEHYDHVGGIDDLRPFSRFGSIDLYMEERLEKVLRERMPYCFTPHNHGGIPDVKTKTINTKESFYIESLEVIPIRVMHYKLPILGYRMGGFAYLTDVKTIPETEVNKLWGLDTLVVSALRKTEHISHQTLGEALELVRRVKPRVTYFTHISHEMGLHATVENELPEDIHLAYDGMEIHTR